ncbi:MAG: hypothetical protein WA395_01065 [Nitrososphaeraceae archaeon]|jgi:hypothetical protein
MVAKTAGYAERSKRKITYALIYSYHSLCLDKKDIIRSELMAYEMLLKYMTEDRKRNNRTKDGIGSLILEDADLALRPYLVTDLIKLVASLAR